MLLPYTSLVYYGPAAGAALLFGDGALAGGIGGVFRAQATVTAAGAVAVADATRLINRPATITGTGSIAAAGARAGARVTATIRVNQLTQDDVTGAVLEALLEPGLTLKQALLDARRAARLAVALSA
jgi:hypothetical protein